MVISCTNGPSDLPGAGLGQLLSPNSAACLAAFSSLILDARCSHAAFSWSGSDRHSLPTMRDTSPKVQSGFEAQMPFRCSLEYRMYPVTSFLPAFLSFFPVPVWGVPRAFDGIGEAVISMSEPIDGGPSIESSMMPNSSLQSWNESGVERGWGRNLICGELVNVYDDCMGM